MTYFNQQTKLVDYDRSRDSSHPSELLIVEGDSASRAVQRLRDPAFQAVLPMQGKPMNAVKASETRVKRNPWYIALVDALGVDWDASSLESLRYDRVILVFDPDADGIHCGALLLMFLDQYLSPLLAANRVSLVKPPLFEITATGYTDSVYAFSEEHLKRIVVSLEEKEIECKHKRYRGLASLGDQTLIETCLDPDCRTAHLLQRKDAEAARSLFGGS